MVSKAMFDDLFLIADGRVIYQGFAASAPAYFAEQGYPCPAYTNPADYLFMDILNNEDGSSSYTDKSGKVITETNRDRVKRLLDHWPTTPEFKEAEAQWQVLKGGKIEQDNLKTISEFGTQTSYLIKRAFTSMFRNPLAVRTRFTQSIVSGVFIALVIRILLAALWVLKCKTKWVFYSSWYSSTS